jgi:hypothetical protein
MTERHRRWRLRVAFEPTRLSSEEMIRVYEQLKPMDSKAIECLAQRAPRKRPRAKRGGS